MADVTISSLGRKGDGVGTLRGNEAFVPFTLPGETVCVQGSGKSLSLASVVTPSRDRIEPICTHFGTCGGCQLQHYENAAYEAWKKKIALEPLKKAGLSFKADDLVTFPIASRRTVTFSANRSDGELHLGFAERGTHSIVDVSECPVLNAELSGALPDIKGLISSLPLGSKPVRVSVLSTTTGIDIQIEGLVRLSSSQRTLLTQKSISSGFARLSLNDEILIEPKRPILEMGIARVTPPPGGFVQAVLGAEITMADLVCEHLKGCKKVADLFCGSGTFALRLAERSSVLAAEESDSAISALERAWRETGGKLKQINAETRNLERRPFGFQELKKIEGLVFDPPRAGAEAQCIQIAKSKVRRVAAVSCNPETLARDLIILTKGGFELKRVIPIDQFRFTPHVEVVALLER